MQRSFIIFIFIIFNISIFAEDKVNSFDQVQTRKPITLSPAVQHLSKDLLKKITSLQKNARTIKENLAPEFLRYYPEKFLKNSLAIFFPLIQQSGLQKNITQQQKAFAYFVNKNNLIKQNNLLYKQIKPLLNKSKNLSKNEIKKIKEYFTWLDLFNSFIYKNSFKFKKTLKKLTLIKNKNIQDGIILIKKANVLKTQNLQELLKYYWNNKENKSLSDQLQQSRLNVLLGNNIIINQKTISNILYSGLALESKNKNYYKVIAYAYELLNYHKNNLFILETLVSNYLKLGEFKKSLFFLEKITFAKQNNRNKIRLITNYLRANEFVKLNKALNSSFVDSLNKMQVLEWKILLAQKRNNLKKIVSLRKEKISFFATEDNKKALAKSLEELSQEQYNNFLFVEADKFLRESLQVNPNINAYKLQAFIYTERGEIIPALRSYEQAIILGDTNYQKYEELLYKFLRKVKKIHQDNLNYLAKWLVLNKDKKRDEEIYQNFKKIAKSTNKEKLALVYTISAKTNLKRKLPIRAYYNLDKSLSLIETIPALKILASMQNKDKYYQDSLSNYQKIFIKTGEEKDNIATITIKYSKQLLKQKKYHKAEYILNYGNGILKTNDRFLNIRLLVAQKTKNKKQLLKIAKKLYIKNKNHVRAKNIIGNHVRAKTYEFYEQGKYRDSINYIQRLREYQKLNSLDKLYLTLNYLDLKKPEEASIVWRNVDTKELLKNYFNNEEVALKMIAISNGFEKFKITALAHSILFLAHKIVNNKKLTTKFVTDYIKSAQYKFTKKKYKSAILDFTIASKIDNNNQAIYLGLATSYYQIDKFREALSYWAKVKNPPKDKIFLSNLYLARYNLALGKLKRAVNFYIKATTNYGINYTNIVAFNKNYQKGNTKLTTSREQLKWINFLEKYNPDIDFKKEYLAIKITQGKEQIIKNNFSNAKNIFLNLLNLNKKLSNNLEILDNLITVELNFKNFKQASFYLRKSLTIKSTEKKKQQLYSIYKNQAKISLQNNNNEDAFVFLQKSTLVYASDPVVWESMGDLRFKQESLEQARFYWKKASTLYSQVPLHLKSKLNNTSFVDFFKLESNSLDEVKSKLKQLTDESKRSRKFKIFISKVYEKIAQNNIENKEYEQAEKILIKSLKIDENNKKALENIAFLATKKEQWNKAIFYLQKLRRQLIDLKKIQQIKLLIHKYYLFYSRYLLKQNKIEDAIIMANRSLLTIKKSQDAFKLLEEIYLIKGNKRQANYYQQQYIK